MKVAAIGILAGLAAAIPQKPLQSTMAQTIASLRDSSGNLDGGVGPKIRNEITDQTRCGKVVFIFARASSEPTNMGGSVGPMLCNALKKLYGESDVLCQGVGGAYTAGILDNIGAKGTSAAAIKEATTMFTQADTKCPDAIFTFGGYSQGTAVMHSAVSGLPESLKKKLVAGVLFGDTRNSQDRSQVPNFPKEKVQVYCAKDDGVCKGSLTVTNGHFAYATNGDADKALTFLKSKIDAARK